MNARGWLRVAALAALACMPGCIATTTQNEDETRAAREAAGLRERPKRLSEAEIRDIFVDRTRVSVAGGLGAQVSYMAPDGTAYLWFPGNRVVLRGRWSIQETGGYRPYAGAPVSEKAVCFEYGADTVNAFTGRRGGLECTGAEIRARLILDSAKGDVLGLAVRREVPFVLPPERTTIASLRARAPRAN